jgi:hypothetical protein
MIKEEFLKNRSDFTMKSLRRFVKKNKDISDDVPIVIERVEDTYFEARVWHDGTNINGWDVLEVEGYQYHSALANNKRMIEEVEWREKGNEKRFSLENPLESIFNEQELNAIKEQFYSGQCIVTDGEIIYIHSHY